VAAVAIDAPLVRALLREQHPDLASLSISELGGGWDNRLFRLGAVLLARMPCRAVSAPLVEHEQRWLPEIAPRLPVPIPVPVRAGRPGCGFPWPWSVVPWFEGRDLLAAPLHDAERAAVDLWRFLQALHRPAPDEAPSNRWRGVPLAAREAQLHSHLAQLRSTVDCSAVLGLWEQVCAEPVGAGVRCGSTATSIPATCCSTAAVWRRSSISAT
jgi:aminoglycoside phosphotransferase (APT) family kinase protein